MGNMDLGKKRASDFFAKIKRYFKDISQIRSTPHAIAIGFAIGTFLAIFPIPGPNILVALLVPVVYKKVNRISLFGALLFWNPLIVVPLNALGYSIGNGIFGYAPPVEYEISFLNKVYYYSRRLYMGNAILAISFAVLGYIVVRLISNHYQLKLIVDKVSKK